VPFEEGLEGIAVSAATALQQLFIFHVTCRV
jgi:hypothetical protein